MHYTLYSCSTREPIETVEMHVLAKAYRSAWRSVWASDPAGPHLVSALDLVVDFGPNRSSHPAPAVPAAKDGAQVDGVPGSDSRACNPGSSRNSAMRGGLKIAAAQFATRAHRGQLDAGGVIPYFEGHVTAVVDVLLETGASEETIAAGYLHDVVAMTTVTLNQIEERFGACVAALVGGASGAWRYTEEMRGAQRAALELERLARESPAVQTLALAHDLANLRNPQWLLEAVRAGSLGEVAARLDRLVLADARLQRYVRDALDVWRAIPWAFGPGPRSE